MRQPPTIASASTRIAPEVHLARSVVSLNDIGLKTLNAGIIYTAGDNAVLGNFETNIGPGTVFFASDMTS